MKRAHARLFLRLYPSAWRARFGVELQDLLETEQGSVLVFADLLRAALIERVFHPSGLGVRPMQTYPGSMAETLERAKGFEPSTPTLARWGSPVFRCLSRYYGSLNSAIPQSLAF